MGCHLHAVELQADLGEPVRIRNLMGHLQQAEQATPELGMGLVGQKLKECRAVIADGRADRALPQAELGGQSKPNVSRICRIVTLLVGIGSVRKKR